VNPAAALAPGLAGALAVVAVYLSFNAAAVPREIEAAAAVASGLAVWAAVAWALPRALRRPSEIEALLAEAGQGGDYAARRTAQLVIEARARLARMDAAIRPRRPELRAAYAEFDERMEPLLDDLMTAPETARRADELLRRTLPRIEGAVTDYCAYAERGDGVVDTAETRGRLIDALKGAGEAADRARRDAMARSGIDVAVSLDILETTLAHSR